MTLSRDLGEQGTHKQHCLVIDGQKTGCDGEEMAQSRSPSKNRTHTSLTTQRQYRYGCDGRTTEVDGYICWGDC